MRNIPLAGAIAMLVTFMVALAAVTMYLTNPVNTGECYILNGGAWQDRVMQVTQVGKYGALAKDMSGARFRINKKAHNYERVDCFDSF